MINDGKLFRRAFTLILVATLSVGFTACKPTAVDSPATQSPESTAAPSAPVIQAAPAVQAPPTTDSHSEALSAFLVGFDKISAQGWVPTLRAGSTGIGYTLETMLDIEENNLPGGDFMGMELKAYRDDDLHMGDAEKMNLFLKEPKWIDGLTHSQRVRQYGYVDDNGRHAMYSTVKIRPNSHGFGFRVDHIAERVFLQFRDRDVAYWTFSVLAKRLNEKHAEAVYVAAHTRGSGKREEFHYYAVTWCCDPSVDEFIELLESGDVMLELRMHLKPEGSVRNHGSAFRIKQNRIPNLYAETIQVRPR